MNDYWIVGGKVYSIHAAAYVPSDDVSYTTWAIDNSAISIAAEELHKMLIQQWLPAQLLSGIILRSTSNPALNGIYPLDQQNCSYIVPIGTRIAAGQKLPGGGNSFVFNGHRFTSAEFLEFATVVKTYVDDLVQTLEQIVMTGTGSLPSTTITIS